MDGSKNPALVHQLDSSQEEATHNLVEEDHSSVTFVVSVVEYPKNIIVK